VMRRSTDRSLRFSSRRFARRAGLGRSPRRREARRRRQGAQ
jgi:hypothetical protein